MINSHKAETNERAFQMDNASVVTSGQYNSREFSVLN